MEFMNVKLTLIFCCNIYFFSTDYDETRTWRVDRRKRADGRDQAAGRREGAACAGAWRRARRLPAAPRPRLTAAAAHSARAPPGPLPVASRAPLPRPARGALAIPGDK